MRATGTAATYLLPRRIEVTETMCDWALGRSPARTLISRDCFFSCGLKSMSPTETPRCAKNTVISCQDGPQIETREGLIAKAVLRFHIPDLFQVILQPL